MLTWVAACGYCCVVPHLTDEQIAALRALPLNEDTPNRLKVAMAIARVTQEDVRLATGIDKSHLSRLVNGRLARIDLETAQTLAAFFGCGTDDLFPAPVAA